MEAIFSLQQSGKIGAGQHYLPWIHIDDIVGLTVTAIENDEYEGPLNGVAPEAVTQAEFSSSLGNALRVWTVPTPKMMVKAMFGERHILLTEGKRIVPQKAIDLGYEWQFPHLHDALVNIK